MVLCPLSLHVGVFPVEAITPARTMIHFRNRMRFKNHKDPLNRIQNPLKSKLLQTLAMADAPPKSRRPVCSSCSKPARICLCSRLRNPGLDNSIGVIILQHSLERNHPLNSARIAKLGLKNVKIATVSDVNFEARFTIRRTQDFDPDEKCCSRNRQNEPRIPQIQVQNRADEFLLEPVITASIGKYGVVNSFDHIWMQRPDLQKLKIDEVFASPAIRASLAKGFIVKKLQKRELEECAEFEIEVPPKSVLLFPSENALTVDCGVDCSDFDVNNLVVLDGTWAKAKRMYNENPWLRLLPHLKLDLEKMSLYSDVRHQPKIGFLSTIESIVYALKFIGDSPDGLDNLLDVFESMIGDQRRCKDERLKITHQV